MERGWKVEKRQSPRKVVLILFLMFSILFAPAAAGAESLTILFTHDLHDHLLPYTVLLDGEITAVGGYARLLAAINAERERDPELLLLDGGDFSMGTLFQTIFASHAPQLRLMGRMGYDVVTFGNHEYDFRAKGLAESITAAKESGERLPQIVASNILFPLDEEGNLTPTLEQLQTAMHRYPVKSYVVLEKKGVKIGVFGLMGRDAASNAPMSEVAFEEYLDAAQRIVDILRNEEGVDLVICLSHAGTDGKSPKTEDEMLAKEVPGIDVIVSGHSHTLLPEPLLVGNTVIGSCGEYGMNLGVIHLARQGDGWELVEYSLKPIDESVAEDGELLGVIAEYKEIVETEYLARFGLEFDQVLAHSPFSFTPSFEIGAQHREEPLGSLISDAYIYAVEQAEGDAYEPVAVAIVPAGTIRGSFVEGDITTSQVFIVSSLGIGADGVPGYPLVSVYLTGKELKTLCEVDASVAPIMGSAQLYMSGLRYEFNPRRLFFNKVTTVKLQNPDGSLVELENDKLYRVVAGLYAGQMLPAVSAKSFGLLSLVPKDRYGNPIEDFEEHIIYDYSQGEPREVKEWYAIAQYLQSFGEVDGLPEIPAKYREAEGRKIVDFSLHPIDLLKNPNKISLVVYGVIIALGVTASLITGRIRRRRKERARKIYR